MPETDSMTSTDEPDAVDTAPDSGPGAEDPRVVALRHRLNEALFEVNHGAYFRARVHGWVAYVDDVNVQLPQGVADRLGTRFDFDLDGDTGDLAAVDAFVMAYHAAETFWRYLFAVLDGSGPSRAPLMEMAGLKAGPAFNKRIEKCVALDNDDIDEVLAFAFLPPEFVATWDGEPTLEELREYLTLWWRALGRYVSEWRNAYNAAKHGLAVGVRPVQLAFLAADGGRPPVDVMNGPVMRTLEHEGIVGENGKWAKDPDTGKPLQRWFWMYRAIDPDELIAQTIVTADLLDWLRAISAARLLGRTGTAVHLRDEPKPLTLKKRTAPGISMRLDLSAVPLPPEDAARVMAMMDDADGDAAGDEDVAVGDAGADETPPEPSFGEGNVIRQFDTES
jgi:hypothetical protein